MNADSILNTINDEPLPRLVVYSSKDFLMCYSCLHYSFLDKAET